MPKYNTTRILAAALSTQAFALLACNDQKETTAPATVVAQSGSKAAAITDESQLAELRKVTARFHTLESAKQAGYAAQITPCWAHHSLGAMGYHFGNTNLFDATADLLQPVLLFYEPQAGGHMRLVGM